MIYTDQWNTTTHLDDGQQVLLRVIQPEDKAEMVRAFQKLSPESRYLRFLSPKDELSGQELHYLTEVDGDHHLALVAGRQRPDGTLEGLGVARFVRLRDDPEAAEFAIVVTDEIQGLGLGTQFFRHLQAAAAERGIARLHGEVLADNARMQNLLHDVAPDVPHVVIEAGVLSYDVPSELGEGGESDPS